MPLQNTLPQPKPASIYEENPSKTTRQNASLCPIHRGLIAMSGRGRCPRVPDPKPCNPSQQMPRNSKPGMPTPAFSQAPKR
jgi:hypothetical protein